MISNCKHFDVIKGKKSFLCPSNEESVHICERCKTQMDLNPRINGTSERILKDAVDSIINELQIWKYQEFVNPDDEKVKKISNFACKLNRDLLIFNELCESLFLDKKKKKRKNFNNNDDNSGVRVGTDALRFNSDSNKEDKKKSW